MLNIKLKRNKRRTISMYMPDLLNKPNLLGLVKISDINFLCQKYISIKLSNLVGFGYDLSYTQDGLRCWEK